MLNVAHRPFNILENVYLSEQQIERLRTIEEYDLWFIIERVKAKKILSEDLTDQAITEFKKYMALVALGHEELGMHSSEVDEIWHNFILFTREYAEFCERVCGHMIHHRPNTSRRPQLPPTSVDTFKKAYTIFFGTIPPIWQAPKMNEHESQADQILSGDCDVVQAPPPQKIFLANECDSQGLNPECDSQGDDDSPPLERPPLCDVGTDLETSPKRSLGALRDLAGRSTHHQHPR